MAAKKKIQTAGIKSTGSYGVASFGSNPNTSSSGKPAVMGTSSYSALSNKPLSTPGASMPAANPRANWVNGEPPADQTYLNDKAALATRNATALQALTANRGDQLRRLGLKTNIDLDRATDDQIRGARWEFDPSDPFSRAQLLQDSYNRAKAGNRTNYAARGQINSGAYVAQARRSDQDNQQAENDLFMLAQQAALGSTADKRKQQEQYEAAIAAAKAALLGRSI